MSIASLLGILMFLVGVPAVTGFLMAQPKYYRLVLTVMVFSTCHIKKPFYQEVLFETYRGVDRGFGVTIPDLLFFGLFFYILLNRRKGVALWPFNFGPWLLIVALSAISVFQSAVTYYGLFTLHKYIRAIVLYWVAVNALRDRKDVQAVINGFIYALVFQGWVVLFDRYVTGKAVNRSVGSFPHPNTLAMYVDLILPVVLSVYLTGTLSKRMGRLAVLGVALGMVAVIFTKSRAALVIMLGAVGATCALSVVWKPTIRKFSVIGVGLFACMIGGAIVAPMIIKRFTEAPKESHETRVYFNHAAIAMANDSTFGVGLNAYSWALANTDYYWLVYPDKLDTVKDLVEFRDSKQGKSRLGTAHHIYYLFAAETGWLGMWCFIVFIGRFYLRAAWVFLRTRVEYDKAIILGMLPAFATLHLQGLLEWIFRQTQVFYLFFIVSGLMVAVSRLPKENKGKQRRVRSVKGRPKSGMRAVTT